MNARHDHASGLANYMRMLQRRRWIIVACALLVPALAVANALREPHKYQASAQVLLSDENLASSLSGIQNQASAPPPERSAQTQAELAGTPAVAAMVLRALHLQHARVASELLAATTVSAEQNADILDFTVVDGSAPLAVALVNQYARQYTIYRRRLDTQAIVAARMGLERQIAEAHRSKGQAGLLGTLLVKDRDLRTMQALQTANATVTRQAQTAKLVQPKPTRDGLLGLLLGVVLGIALALARESLDTRVRSGDEVAQRLGTQVIGRLAEPPRELRDADELVMRADFAGPHAEAFRVLRINLEFTNLERRARTIMVTSALQGEGKSTTVANLGLCLAHARQRVIVVDMDLRRPYMHRFFGLRGHPGITDVVRGRAQIEDALVPIALPYVSAGGPITGPANGNGADASPTVRPRVAHLKLGALDLQLRSAPRSAHGGGAKMLRRGLDGGLNGSKSGSLPTPNGAPHPGSLEVVGVGAVPPNPSDFLGSEQIAEILRHLSARAETVLIDASPLLGIGDALMLSAHVDALLLVCRLDVIRRGTLHALDKVVESSRSKPVGLVLTGAESEESYGYGYGYGHPYPSYYYARAEQSDAQEADFVHTMAGRE